MLNIHNLYSLSKEYLFISISNSIEYLLWILFKLDLFISLYIVVFNKNLSIILVGVILISDLSDSANQISSKLLILLIVTNNLLDSIKCAISIISGLVLCPTNSICKSLI